MYGKFQDLVTSHIKWREGIAELAKHGISTDMIETVRCDDKCEIGQWFDGEGQEKYGGLPEFIAAKEAHSRFHKAAAQSLERSNEIESEDEMSKMIKAFLALNNKIGGME